MPAPKIIGGPGRGYRNRRLPYAVTPRRCPAGRVDAGHHVTTGVLTGRRSDATRPTRLEPPNAGGRGSDRSRADRSNSAAADASGLVGLGIGLPARQALVSAVATSYLLGVCTRRVEKLVEQLGIKQLSKS
jgi:hypothetical protein